MPGLNGALALRINDGQADRFITHYARGLKFTKTAPGGHRSISCQAVVPRGTFRDLGPQDKAYLFDTRTAKTIFDAYLENPTPVDGPQGQQFDISAVGGMALANDETSGLIYITRDHANFEKDTGSTASADIETGEWADDPTYTRVRTTLSGGSVVATNTFSGAGNYAFDRAAMNLGAIRLGAYKSGQTDAGYLEVIQTPSGVVFSRSMSTTLANHIAWVGDTNFPAGTRRFALYLYRTGGATNVADDTTWTDFIDVMVLGQRMDRYGTLLSGSGGLVSAISVLASQVVEDLLGRLLTMCDPATADIQATTWAIDQLAYPDGVKAAGVLNDLELWEPDHDWGIGATGPNGLHSFWYRPWPAEHRYEVSVKDGWRQTGSDVDLCNRILVSWTDATGKIQTLPVTADDLGLVGIGLPVDALGTRVKDADPITLPDGLGSAANALRIGGAILTDKINPPKAGTVVVRRPIMNLQTGVEEMPWELEPGAPVRVRETGDLLRCTEVAYDDDSVSSVLTLGRPVLTTEQRVARLSAA